MGLAMAGIGGLCNSDQSKEAVYHRQAMWIRWIECLKFKITLPNKILLVKGILLFAYSLLFCVPKWDRERIWNI